MSCSVDIFAEVLFGETPGGVITFDFYSTTADDTADSGGTDIEVGTNGIVDFNGAVAGFYYFTYTVGEGDCEQSIQFYIQVIDRPNAGIGQTINLCTTDAPINLFSLIQGSPDLTGTWSGSGTLSPGYDADDPLDPLDDTFDPDAAGEGLYTFFYSVNVVIPPGYTISNCPNCQQAQSTITINVIDCSPPPPCDAGISNAIQVCKQAGCIFNLIDQLDGTPQPNGQWLLLPGAPQTIIITGGYLGTVNFSNVLVGTYNFQYSLSNVDPECTNTSIVTVQVVNAPNAGNDNPMTLCDTASNTGLISLITGNPTTGGVFTISPALPVGTFNANGNINPAVGDAGVYTVTYTVTTSTNENPCNTICQDVSTHVLTIYANCNAGANSGVTICQTGSITLSAATLLGGTPGGNWFVFGQSPTCNNVFTAALFSVNGGPVQNWAGGDIADGSVLDDFQSLGCIAMIYSCVGAHPTCFDSATFMLTIINCSAGCNASVSISTVGCVMSSLITGTCPTPIYQWQQFISGSWVDVAGATSSGYTGTNGGTYRLRVTNCTNCPPLFSNQLTLSCPPAPVCSISCVLTYNVALQRLQAVITNSGAAGGSVGYQFNKYNTNNASCVLCTGVAVATCSGTVVVPPLGNVQVNCNVAQTAVEQCWRFVTLAGACNQTLCCAKIPASAATMCYELPSLPLNTGIIGINIDGANQIGDAQFNCDEYESTQPAGTMNGIVNCSLAQMVIDINQWLVANGKLGTASIRQSSKSSTLRIKDTDAVFNLITINGGSTINFIQSSSGCTLCDTVSWHFQALSQTDNFPSVDLFYSGAPGTFNLFDFLDLYFPEIPHTGLFTSALCNVPSSGCIDINTDCWTDCSPPPATPVTVTNNVGFANHGDLNWITFTQAQIPICFWHIRYLVTLPNACQECLHINVKFTNVAP